MSRLHELQRQFRDALLRNETGGLCAHIHKGGLDLDAQLGIYRNNVFTNLREALRTLFPVINQLVGEAFFDYATDAYIRCTPSPAGDLNQFGESLSNFFAEFEPAAGLPYLADVARLEWLVHRVYHSAGHPGFNYARLAGVDPECYGNLHFRLDPACALFTSTYPVHRIWQVNQPGCTGETIVDLTTGGVKLLIARRGGRIQIQTLTTGAWRFLDALAANADFATACAQALASEPQLDLSTTLTELITSATLVDFEVREPCTNSI